MKLHCVAKNRDLDANRQLVVDLRIVEHVGKAIDAVWYGSDSGPHLALGIIEQRVASREHSGNPVFRAQRLEALHADPVRLRPFASIRYSLAGDGRVDQGEDEVV